MADEDVSNDGPLTLSEAVKAYSAPEPTEEIQEDQTEVEDGQDSEIAEEELPSDEEGEDEGEPDDEEGQPDEDGEEDEDDPDSDQGRFVSDNAKVKLPDGSVISVAELKSGNLRDRDYRQKTMAHAEDVKAFKSQSEAVTQKEQQVSEQATYVADLLRTIVPAAPDPALLQTDPMAYIAQEASHKQWVAHLTYLDQQKQQATEASQAEAAKAEQDKASTEWEALVEKVPELKDPKRNDRFVADIISTGKDYGFTPQELRAVALDHRYALVFKDAIGMRKLQAAKAKNTTETPPSRPPVQKGSKRHSAEGSRHRAANSALERLNKSGSLKDGVAAYLATQSKG